MAESPHPYHGGMGVILIVIGRRDSLRNPELRFLENLGVPVLYSNPVYVRDQDQRSFEYNDHLAKLALGRSMLAGEIGCSLAHIRAVEVASSHFIEDPNLAWCLVLEDDANVSPAKLLAIREQLLAFHSIHPEIVNFFRDPLVELLAKTDKPKLYRLPYQSPMALCYAINRAATSDYNRLANSPVSFVADWPPYLSRIRFWSSNISVIDTGALSTIGVRGNYHLWSRISLILRQLCRIRELAEAYNLSIRHTVVALILRPLIRDGLHYALKIFNTKQLQT